MTVERIPQYPYPEKFQSIEDVYDYTTNLHNALSEEATLRVLDFQDFIDNYGKRVETWGDGLQYDSATWTASVDYNTTNLKITSTELNTIQDIATTSTPTFDDLTISTPVNIYALSHNSFADYAANRHIDWTDATSNFKTTVASGYAGLFTGGNVGVGTLTPTERFVVKVAGTGWADAHFALEAAASTNQWDFTIGGSDHFYIGYAEDTKFQWSTGGNMYLEDGGLGILATSFGTSQVGGMALKTGTAPSGNVVDQFAMYSADFGAGNACPHFRTENGTVIQLNQTLATTDSPAFTAVTLGSASQVGSLEVYDGSSHKITVTCPSIAGDWILTLPTVDGDSGQYLQTNGSGTTTWATVSTADEKVGIDSGATAGYLGAASNDGVLRVDATLDYTDGGDFVTLGVDSTKVTNWDAANTHISSNGTDHTYIDQDLQIAASPTFATPNATVAYNFGGAQILKSVATGNYIVGDGLANLAAGGNYNFALGTTCLDATTTGDYSVGIGYEAGYYNQTGSYNCYIGYQAGKGASGNSHSYNTGINYQALYSLTTGHSNVGIGVQAGYYNQTGTYNCYIGYGAGAGASGQSHSGNIGIGYQSLYSVTTGPYNTALGYRTLYSLTTGLGNFAAGYQAGYYNQTGNYNYYAGYGAGLGVSGNSHSNNVGIGYHALILVTTGGNNVCIGYQAGNTLTTGTAHVMLGYQAGSGETTANSLLYIANASTDAATLIHGDFAGQDLLTKAPTAAAADALFHASDIQFYLDEGANNLMVKVKYSDDSTFKTGTVCAVA